MTLECAAIWGNDWWLGQNCDTQYSTDHLTGPLSRTAKPNAHIRGLNNVYYDCDSGDNWVLNWNWLCINTGGDTMCTNWLSLAIYLNAVSIAISVSSWPVDEEDLSFPAALSAEDCQHTIGWQIMRQMSSEAKHAEQWSEALTTPTRPLICAQICDPKHVQGESLAYSAVDSCGYQWQFVYNDMRADACQWRLLEKAEFYG